MRPCAIPIAATACCLLLSAASTAQDRRVAAPQSDVRPKRVALVIGNNTYGGSPLENAVNDARAMHQALADLGFEVQKAENVGLEGFGRSVDRFIGNLGAGDVGLFFYSGHGMQIDGANYLVPVDFSAPDEAAAKYRSIPAEMIRERMEDTGARVSILVLDACRDNPYRGSRSGSGGLAAMQGGRGTLIAFATAPGKTASDNRGASNGLFTKHLIQALRRPGLDVDDVFDQVREQVDRESGHRQTPWVADSVIGKFYFLPGSGEPSAPAADVTGPGTRPAGMVPGMTRLPEGLRRDGTKIIRVKDGMEMVKIPAGIFGMGSTEEEYKRAVEQAVGEGIERGDAEQWFRDEKPAHRVRLSAYLIDRYEVSNEQYLKYVRATGHRVPENGVDSKFNVWIGSTHPPGLADHPVVNVSWDDAVGYCSWAGGRLPTEAEWEKAARGTGGQVYPWGSGWVAGRANHGRYDRDSEKWYSDDSDGHASTSPVGAFEGKGGGSPYGVQDMAGNAYEWVSDWYGEYPATEVSDPEGPATGEYRVLRGGSWGSSPTALRVAGRAGRGPVNRYYAVGFRCARDFR